MNDVYADLAERLRKRAEIRRQIPTRKSVQDGEPDRIADLLEEAATTITELANVHDDFCKCYEVANKMDALDPEAPGAFTGSVSERLERAFSRTTDRIGELQYA